VGAIEVYPALVESGKGLVAQTEVEVLVEKDGCKVLTK
jgi:methionine aminopeptidase